MNKCKLLIILLTMSSKSYSSSMFIPDGDTALLIQILGAEIQATAGILKIIEATSDTVDKMEEVHYKISDIHTKTMQAQYYAKALVDMPKNQERVHSMVHLRNNIYKVKSLSDERNTLTLGYDLLKKSNDNGMKLTRSSMRQNELDRRMAMQYFKNAGDGKKTADGAITGARASSLSALKLVGISETLNTMNAQAIIKSDYENRRNSYFDKKEINERHSEYIRKKNWGIIPKNITFQKYESLVGRYVQN